MRIIILFGKPSPKRNSDSEGTFSSYGTDCPNNVVSMSLFKASNHKTKQSWMSQCRIHGFTTIGPEKSFSNH